VFSPKGAFDPRAIFENYEMSGFGWLGLQADRWLDRQYQKHFLTENEIGQSKASTNKHQCDFTTQNTKNT
jgi:hypothetical protein